jgi:multidrug transporter EmrE-like cation transporter
MILVVKDKSGPTVCIFPLFSNDISFVFFFANALKITISYAYAIFGSFSALAVLDLAPYILA